jgi:hypothetical protein
MIDCIQSNSTEPASESEDENLMLLSAAAVGTVQPANKSMKHRVQIQGQSFLFLVDSGSSACFIDQRVADLLPLQTSQATPMRVKVAGGAILTSSTVLPALSWSSNGHEFIDSFRVLALDSYDGIIGWDWLAKYSPMLTHWGEQWIAIQMRGEFVVLHGEEAYGNSPTILELHILSDQAPVPQQHPRPGIQALLDEFASVF